MKKYLPLLLLYPVVACIASMFLVGTPSANGATLIGLIVVAIGYFVEFIVPIVYFYKQKDYKYYLAFAGPVPFVLSLFANIDIAFEQPAFLILLMLPAVSSALCVLTIKTVNQKKTGESPAPEKKTEEGSLQKASAAPEVQKNPDSDIPVEKLKQLKDLLDMGAITQEEFDAKKKQLLGL